MLRSNLGLPASGLSQCAVLFCAALFCASLWNSPLAEAQAQKQKWVSNAGTAIDAEFVRLDAGSVVVKKDGKEIAVPLSKLSLESHLQALQLAKPDAYAKPAPKAIVGLEQTAESTKLLNESPFTADQTIEQCLDTLASELQAGNATAFWHMLTPEMQADVEDVVVSAVDLGGKGMLVQWRALMKHLATIVHDKKAFILAFPMVASNQKLTRDLQLNWDQVVEFTDAVTDKPNWDSANFKAGSVGPWIAAISTKLGKSFVKMSEMAAKSGVPDTDLKKELAYKINSQSADSALVQWLAAAPPVMNPQTRQLMPSKPKPPEEWVKVSGKWLPKELVANWKDNIALTKSQLDLVMPRASGGLSFVVPVAASLANAKTQQEFNTVLQQILAPLMNMRGSMGGQNGMAGMGGSSGMDGSMGMGSSMGMGMDSSMGSSMGMDSGGVPGGRPGKPALGAGAGGSGAPAPGN